MKMAKKNFEPLKCPACGRPLDRIEMIMELTFTFDSKTGRYEVEREHTAWCESCGGDLPPDFPIVAKKQEETIEVYIQGKRHEFTEAELERARRE